MLLKYKGLFAVVATVVMLSVIMVTLWGSDYFMSWPMKSRVAETVIDLAENTWPKKWALEVEHRATQNLPSLWTDKTHLCVMFNLNRVEPRKDITDVLVSYYVPFFENITFIFDGANRERPDFLPEFVNFNQHMCLMVRTLE